MIRQFDIFANPDPSESAVRPYLVNLQANILSELRSIIVAPLVAHDDMQGAQRLNPLVSISDQQYWLATHELFALDRRALRDRIGSVEKDRDAIIAALDLIFTGI